MTRGEEIRNYVYNNCITKDFDDRTYRLIVDAINWADENPKEGLVSIEKAAEWVKNSFKETFGEGLAENIKQEFIETMTK